jgi:hypothetical protein
MPDLVLLFTFLQLPMPLFSQPVPSYLLCMPSFRLLVTLHFGKLAISQSGLPVGRLGCLPAYIFLFSPLQNLMTFRSAFPGLPPARGRLDLHFSGSAGMDLAVLGRLYILLHSFFIIQVCFSKHLPGPGRSFFCNCQALDHQVPRRPTHCRQFLLGYMLFWNKAQVHVDCLACLFSRSNCVSWRAFFPPYRFPATGLRLGAYVSPYSG